MSKPKDGLDALCEELAYDILDAAKDETANTLIQTLRRFADRIIAAAREADNG